MLKSIITHRIFQCSCIYLMLAMVCVGRCLPVSTTYHDSIRESFCISPHANSSTCVSSLPSSHPFLSHPSSSSWISLRHSRLISHTPYIHFTRIPNMQQIFDSSYLECKTTINVHKVSVLCLCVVHILHRVWNSTFTTSLVHHFSWDIKHLYHLPPNSLVSTKWEKASFSCFRINSQKYFSNHQSGSDNENYIIVNCAVTIILETWCFIRTWDMGEALSKSHKSHIFTWKSTRTQRI
jgi:hypothetical protein